MPKSACNADWPHLHGLAAHWDKNTNAAAAFDHWFLNLFPRIQAFEFNGGGYQTLNFIPVAGDDDFRSVGRRAVAQRPAGWQKFGLLIGAGLLGLLVGWGLDAAGVCPLVKRIWTPSWTFFSTGWTLLLLAGFYGVVDLLGFRRWTFPLVVVGMNSLRHVLHGGPDDRLAGQPLASSLWLRRVHALGARGPRFTNPSCKAPPCWD